MSVFEILSQQPAVFYLLVALLGLVVGSFLNVVIYRYPRMLKRQWKADCLEFLQAEQGQNIQAQNSETARQEQKFSLLSPPSQCPHCQHKISAVENIPLVSWLFLKGKCRQCQKKISIRYPLVELMTALLSVWIASQFGPTLQTFFLFFLLWSLIALSFIDIDTQYLPDEITLSLLWLGLLASLLGITSVKLDDAVIGAMAGYLVLWSIFHLFRLLTGKEGMGYGDFKLLAALGAWMGWQYLADIVFLSALVGSAIGLANIVIMGRQSDLRIPYGPYLSGAGFLALVLPTAYLPFNFLL